MIGELWNSCWLVPLYALAMAAIVAFGRWLAYREERKQSEPRQCRVGPFERSVGAMLAFLIGFTFAFSGGNFRDVQATLHRESDAIAETYRWSLLLPDTDRVWLRKCLQDYTELLIHPEAGMIRHPGSATIDQVIRAEQTRLWEGLTARRSGAADRGNYDSCLRAVNQFIQAYDLRYYLERRRLADVLVLFILGATLLIGFLVGYTSELRRRHFAIIATLFVFFITAMVYLIWEVDHPTEGWITPSRQSLTDMAEQLKRGGS
jgi:hypothetical protein